MIKLYSCCATLAGIERIFSVFGLIVIGVNVVKVVPKVKNLGFVLKGRLTGTDHFRKVCQRVYCILRSLWRYATNILFEVPKRLVLSSLILSHFNYGNIVFTVADSALQRRLGVAFKACLHYIHIKDIIKPSIMSLTKILLLHQQSTDG
jgi:hypothetical protein